MGSFILFLLNRYSFHQLIVAKTYNTVAYQGTVVKGFLTYFGELAKEKEEGELVKAPLISRFGEVYPVFYLPAQLLAAEAKAERTADLVPGFFPERFC